MFASLIARGVATTQGFFSDTSNNRVDTLLTSSKVGCAAHDAAVRGGILNYGGYTLSAKENENEF